VIKRHFAECSGAAQFATDTEVRIDPGSVIASMVASATSRLNLPRERLS
jgi:hypothetical protein